MIDEEVMKMIHQELHRSSLEFIEVVLANGVKVKPHPSLSGYEMELLVSPELLKERNNK